MIVVNPRNHWVKSTIFQDAVWDFHYFWSLQRFSDTV